MVSPELRIAELTGMHIWARGCFVSTVGIDSTVIQFYVKEQADDQIREEQLRLWKDDSE